MIPSWRRTSWWQVRPRGAVAHVEPWDIPGHNEAHAELKRTLCLLTRVSSCRWPT